MFKFNYSLIIFWILFCVTIPSLAYQPYSLVRYYVVNNAPFVTVTVSACGESHVLYTLDSIYIWSGDSRAKAIKNIKVSYLYAGGSSSWEIKSPGNYSVSGKPGNPTLDHTNVLHDESESKVIRCKKQEYLIR